jgi:hypothetical protein
MKRNDDDEAVEPVQTTDRRRPNVLLKRSAPAD